MAKQSQTSKKLTEFHALENSVVHVRELMSGKRALGLDFALSSSLAKFSAIFAAAAGPKGEAEVSLLGEPDKGACSALAAGFNEMQGAVLSQNQAKVDEIMELFSRLNALGMIETYLASKRMEYDARVQADVQRAAFNVEMSIRTPRTRGDMSDVPTDRYAGGFGLSEVDEWEHRLAAVGRTIAVVDSSAFPDKERIEDLEKVARIFAAVSAADKPDWYSLSRFLGHPSSVHSRDMANALFSMASALKYGRAEPFEEYRSICTVGYVGEMLDNYLTLASGGYYVPESGAVYVAWSSSDRHTLQIGVAYEQIEDELRILDRELGLRHRHGILAAWLVHDVDEARDAIAAKLRDRAQPGDLGYRIRLLEAKSEIQGVLELTANTVLSPWHGDEEPAIAGGPKTAPASALL